MRALAKDSVSLWEVLSAGLASAGGEGPVTFTVMLQLYTELQSKMRELTSVCLRQLVDGEQPVGDKEVVQVS